MPRPLRIAVGEMVYHVHNRANGRMQIFARDSDYSAFEQVLIEARERVRMRVLACCLMPNHWHLVLWPYLDGDLTSFVSWLTMTHAQRWHAYHGTVGSGHLYQGRFKASPVETDDHFLKLCRYVERNALRANLVGRAEDWRWCSLWHREQGDSLAQRLLSEWPVNHSSNWVTWVNEPQTPEDLKAIRACLARGRPYGSESWRETVCSQLGLVFSPHPRGRPRKIAPDPI